MFVNADEIIVGKHGGFINEYEEGCIGSIYVDGIGSNDGKDKRVVIEVTKTQLEDLKTKIDKFLEGEK